MSTTIGYLRVSTQEQDVKKNKAGILELANDKKLGNVKWVEEKISGTKDWKERKLGEVVHGLGKGDNIVTSEISRLGRSTLQVLEVIKECRIRGVSVYAVKGGWEMNESISSKMTLILFGMVAEIERDFISERTKEGLAALKARGIRLGRPPGPGKSRLDVYKEEIIALLRTGSRKTYVSKKYGVTPAALHNWIRQNKIKVVEDMSAPAQVAQVSCATP